MRVNHTASALDVFYSLVRSGLWGTSVVIPSLNDAEWNEILSAAKEQTVMGLVGDGLSRALGGQPPKAVRDAFISALYVTELRNRHMNTFLASLSSKLSEAGIHAVVVKGQGIAQCYRHPDWRQSGDIDLLLNGMDYDGAKSLLIPLARSVSSEVSRKKHLPLQIDSVEVELHGTLHAELSRKMDVVIDTVQEEMFSKSLFRKWNQGGVDILLPDVDADVVFVFTHILQHFFKGGIGLRQICDWCRLLWSFADKINRDLLEKRLRKMGLMSEWRTFGCFAVQMLGMPADAMPFYQTFSIRRLKRLSRFFDCAGNFGQNRDLSYQRKGLPVSVRKVITVWRQAVDNIRMISVFPVDSFRFLCGYIRFKMQKA